MLPHAIHGIKQHFFNDQNKMKKNVRVVAIATKHLNSNHSFLKKNDLINDDFGNFFFAERKKTNGNNSNFFLIFPYVILLWSKKNVYEYFRIKQNTSIFRQFFFFSSVSR